MPDPAIGVLVRGERPHDGLRRAIAFEVAEAAALEQAGVPGDELGGSNEIGHAASVAEARRWD